MVRHNTTSLIRQYLLATFLPSITMVAVGLFRMPEDCQQCLLLLLVGFGLMFLALLVLNLTYFFMLLQPRATIVHYFLGFFACFTPSILLTVYLFKTYYHPDKLYNTDFDISIPTSVMSFVFNSWTYFRYIK